MIFGKIIATIKKKFKRTGKKKKARKPSRKKPAHRKPSISKRKKRIPKRKVIKRKRKSPPKRKRPKKRTLKKKTKALKKVYKSRRPVRKTKIIKRPVKKFKKPSGASRKDEEPKGIFVGEITHYFSKIEVCVIKVANSYIRIGDQLRIVGGGSSFSQKVKSLQIENSDVKVAVKGQLVGMKARKKVRENYKVYKVV